MEAGHSPLERNMQSEVMIEALLYPSPPGPSKRHFLDCPLLLKLFHIMTYRGKKKFLESNGLNMRVFGASVHLEEMLAMAKREVSSHRLSTDWRQPECPDTAAGPL